MKERILDNIRVNAENSWVIFNVQQTGFYRVNYDEVSWGLIVDALKSDAFTDIHEVNRAQLIDDALQLARGGVLKYDFALDLVTYLMDEQSYHPWLSAFNSFSFLTSRMSEHNLEKFKMFIGSLLKKAYEMVGFVRDPDEPQTRTYLRSHVLNWACKIDHKDCVAKAREIFDQFKNATNRFVV